MTGSMYRASAPVFTRSLRNLAEVLRKGEAHATSHSIESQALLGARLFPDMYPLARQVQAATEAATLCVARLAGVEPPVSERRGTSFAELQGMVGDAIAYIEGFPESKFSGAEERSIVQKTSTGDMRYRGEDYLFNLALPNFFFHVTTAYNLLRHNGVRLVKRDYLGLK